jgi:endo-1,3(4)-beta-glucanase
VPTSLLEHTDAMSKLCPPKYVDVKNRAIPTNNWWGNLIAHDASAAKIQPIWSNPYSLQVVSDLAPFGLAVSYPFRSRFSSGSSGNTGAVRYYAHGQVREMLFSASEFASSKPAFRVVDWADQGVSVELKATANGGNGKIESDFVSGMVYTSAKYTSLTPKLVSTAAITSVNGQAVKAGDVVRGSKFQVSYNSGQTWVVYALSADGQADKEVSFTVDGGSTLSASSGPFDGILRVALAVESNWVATLDTYRLCIVKGAALSIDSDSAYSFKWKTAGNCAQGLLHFAMKHHVDALDASAGGGNGLQKIDGMVAQSTTRGAFQAYATSPSSPIVWKLSEQQEVPEGFYPKRKIDPFVVQSQRILEHLRIDILCSEWYIPVDGSYYFNGKTAQKYASLCLMANDPAIVGSSDKSLLQHCLGKLRSVLAPFVSNSWSNRLQYDRVYGGIVSSEGFKKNDLNADFGNTMYNDHHFHYGYWIHAAAVVNLLDPTWADLAKLNTMANLLARDVANYGADDSLFPRFRSFDWFRGHSYSHGVTPFADGKDQESTSEDVNFSFALFLFGSVTKNAEMAQVGKLMTKLNAHAIKTYFLIEDANAVHPLNFRPNKVTGIFFDNKVDYATWFSTEKHCIHGIQMVPVSAVTEFVRTKAFVKEEWDQVLAKEQIVTRENTTNSWLSLLYTNYATVNKAKAMSVLQKAKMDDGLSRAWALYMAASFAEETANSLSASLANF